MSFQAAATFIQLAHESLEGSERVPKECALEFSNIAIGHALIAIGQELKRYNDRVDLDRENESHLIG